MIQLFSDTLANEKFLVISVADPWSRVLPAVLLSLPKKGTGTIGNLVAFHTIDDTVDVLDPGSCKQVCSYSRATAGTTDQHQSISRLSKLLHIGDKICIQLPVKLGSSVFLLIYHEGIGDMQFSLLHIDRFDAQTGWAMRA